MRPWEHWAFWLQKLCPDSHMNSTLLWLDVTCLSLLTQTDGKHLLGLVHAACMCTERRLGNRYEFPLRRWFSNDSVFRHANCADSLWFPCCLWGLVSALIWRWMNCYNHCFQLLGSASENVFLHAMLFITKCVCVCVCWRLLISSGTAAEREVSEGLAQQDGLLSDLQKSSLSSTRANSQQTHAALERCFTLRTQLFCQFCRRKNVLLSSSQHLDPKLEPAWRC